MANIIAQLESSYQLFLNIFPHALQPLVSVLVGILLVYIVIQAIRKDFIYIILLVVLLPASIPILHNIGQGVLELVKYLFHMG